MPLPLRLRTPPPGSFAGAAALLVALAACGAERDGGAAGARAGGTAPPVEAVAVSPPVVVADGRVEAPASDFPAWAARPAFRRATEAARAHWRGEDPGFEEDVRIFGVADGSFTEAGAEQQALLFGMSPWPRGFPKAGLAVFEGGRLVRNVAFSGLAQTLAAVPDLDADGLDELVTTGSFGMGGQESRSATLLAFEPGGLVERGGTSISESSCASGRADFAPTAARVLAAPGPTFSVERYEGTCEAATWRLVSGPEPLVLDGASDAVYADLPVQ